jgi:hypothetical protein
MSSSERMSRSIAILRLFRCCSQKLMDSKIQLVIFLDILLTCLFADEKSVLPSDLPRTDSDDLSSILVHVVLDTATKEQLSPSSPDTNKHSLRSLWDEDVDYWDIRANHSCSVKCTFDTSDESRVRANGILFSAQLFPAFSLFSDVMDQVCEPC